MPAGLRLQAEGAVPRPPGRREEGVSFSETVFYAFRDGKIGQVWSIIDKAIIEAQIQP